MRYVIADQLVRQAARPALDAFIAARLHVHPSTIPLTPVLQWDIYYVKSCFEVQLRMITRGTRRTSNEV